MKFYSFLVLLVLVIFLVVSYFFEITFDSDGIITWKVSYKKQDTDLIISKQVCILSYLSYCSKYSLFMISNYLFCKKSPPSRSTENSRGNAPFKADVLRENHNKIVGRIKKQQQISNNKYNPPIFKTVL